MSHSSVGIEPENIEFFTVLHSQRCGSGMFIPDPRSRIPIPDFYSSQIPDPKTVTKERMKKNLLSYLFFVATNFTKLIEII